MREEEKKSQMLSRDSKENNAFYNQMKVKGKQRAFKSPFMLQGSFMSIPCVYSRL